MAVDVRADLRRANALVQQAQYVEAVELHEQVAEHYANNGIVLKGIAVSRQVLETIEKHAQRADVRLHVLQRLVGLRSSPSRRFAFFAMLSVVPACQSSSQSHLGHPNPSAPLRGFVMFLRPEGCSFHQCGSKDLVAVSRFDPVLQDVVAMWDDCDALQCTSGANGVPEVYVEMDAWGWYAHELKARKVYYLPGLHLPAASEARPWLSSIVPNAPSLSPARRTSARTAGTPPRNSARPRSSPCGH